MAFFGRQVFGEELIVYRRNSFAVQATNSATNMYQVCVSFSAAERLMCLMCLMFITLFIEA